jgi:hypothetical protein
MNSLLLIEVTRFNELEQVISIGLGTFVQVGAALLEIRDSRLYRGTHGTFEEYCQDRWDIARNYANKLIAAASVVLNLGTNSTQPTHESQVRPLTSLDPQQQREAWAEPTKENPAPTAREVSEAAEIIAPVHQWEKHRPVSFDHEGVTPPMTDDQRVLRRFKAWVSAISKEKNLTRKQVVQYVYQYLNGRVQSLPSADSQPAENEFCEVGWLLLTTERNMAVLALTPGNEDWRESALEFFGSLRKRKIITVS